MTKYTMPGVAVGRRGSMIVGAASVAATLVFGIAWHTIDDDSDQERMRVQLRTEHIGDGIIAGAKVVYNGVKVGEIETVDSVGLGNQLITLALDPDQIPGLTDTLEVGYAPENLFGVSAVSLIRAPGGTALHEGAVVDLAGAAAQRVRDATMGALLRSLTETSTTVLTPELSTLVGQLATNTRAFTPLLEAVVTLSRVVADTQQYPTSFLIDQYAGFLHGAGQLTSDTFRLLKAIFEIEVLRNDRELFDTAINLVVETVFPAVAVLGQTLQAPLDGYVPMLSPLLSTLAATVPTPGQSQADLRELMDRVDRMFTDTPNGPVLNLSVALAGVPALAVPLLNGVPR